MIPSITLTWKQLLDNGFVFGVPNFFNQTYFNPLYFTEKDHKLLEKGQIQRFPSKLYKRLSHLRSRSFCTSGIRVEFMTSAKQMSLDIIHPKVGSMDNMSKLAQRGVDILVDGKAWVMFYGRSNKLPVKFGLPLDKTEHRITILFPTYAPCILKSITLYKIPENEPKLRSPWFKKDGKPVIYYGSSITQGGCSSRPSLSYPFLISEDLNLNFINLGTSGVGYGEPEVAEYVASFKNASLFVLDWGANLLNPEHRDLLEQRYNAFWQKIHSENPNIPILFIGFQGYFQEIIDPMAKIYINSKRDFVENEALKACTLINQNQNNKLAESISGLSLFNASELNNTVDGVHPNDLGHRRYAEVISQKIKELLKI